MHLTAKVNDISFIQSNIRVELVATDDKKINKDAIKKSLSENTQNGVSFKISFRGTKVILEIVANAFSSITQQDAVLFVKLLLDNIVNSFGLKIKAVDPSYIFKLGVSNISTTEFGDLGRIQKILATEPNISVLAKSNSGSNVYVRVVSPDVNSAERDIYSKLKNKEAVFNFQKQKLEFDDKLVPTDEKIEEHQLNVDEPSDQGSEKEKEDIDDASKDDSASIYAATAYPSYLNLMENLFNDITLGTWHPSASLPHLLERIDQNAEKEEGNHVVDYQKEFEYLMKQLSYLFWAKFRADRLRGAVYHDRIRRLLEKKPEYDSLLRKFNVAHLERERAAQKLEKLADKDGKKAEKDPQVAEALLKAQQAYAEADKNYNEQYKELVSKVPEASPAFSVKLVNDALLNKIKADGVDASEEKDELRRRQQDLLRSLKHFDYKTDTIYDKIDPYFLTKDLESVVPNLFYIYPTTNATLEKTMSGETPTEYIESTVKKELREKYKFDSDILKKLPDLEKKVRSVLSNEQLSTDEKKQEIGKVLPDTEETNERLKKLVDVIAVESTDVFSKIKNELQTATGSSLSDTDVLNLVKDIINNGRDVAKTKEKLPNVKDVAELVKDANDIGYYLDSLKDFISEDSKVDTVFLKSIDKTVSQEEKVNAAMSEVGTTNNLAKQIVDTVDNYKKSYGTGQFDAVQDTVSSWLVSPRDEATDARGVSETGAAKVPYEVVQRFRDFILSHWGTKNVEGLKSFLDLNFLLSKYDKNALQNLVDAYSDTDDESKQEFGNLVDNYSEYMLNALPPFFHTKLEDVDDVDEFNKLHSKYQKELDNLATKVQELTGSTIKELQDETVFDTLKKDKERFKEINNELRSKFSGVKLKDIVDFYDTWQDYLDNNPEYKMDDPQGEEVESTIKSVQLESAYDTAISVLTNKNNTEAANNLKKIYNEYILKGQKQELNTNTDKEWFTDHINEILKAISSCLDTVVEGTGYQTITDLFEKGIDHKYDKTKNTIRQLLAVYKDLVRFYRSSSHQAIGDTLDTLLQKRLPKIHKFINECESSLSIYDNIRKNKTTQPYSEKRAEHINSNMDKKLSEIKEYFSEIDAYRKAHGETPVLEELTDKLSRLAEIYSDIKYKVNRNTEHREIQDAPIDYVTDKQDGSGADNKQQKFNVPVEDLLNTTDKKDGVDYGELNKKEEK